MSLSYAGTLIHCCTYHYANTRASQMTHSQSFWE